MSFLRRGVCLVALVALLVGSAPAANAGTTPEARAHALINRARTAHDLRPLVRSRALDELAERHARQMRAAGDLFHSSDLGGLIPGAWRGAGENVGYAGSVTDLHRALMRSPGHRANILRAGFDQVGIGIVVGNNGRVWETQIFVDRG